MNIINFHKISDRISTSGQPGEGDFAVMAGQDFRTVINLALPTSDNAIGNEGAIVAGAGMNYVHIPVEWEAPRVDQFHTFAAVMDQCAPEKVWVHCALNMRVTCFMYLYLHLLKGMPEAQASSWMDRIWDPGDFPAWREFIDEVKRAVPVWP